MPGGWGSWSSTVRSLGFRIGGSGRGGAGRVFYGVGDGVQSGFHSKTTWPPWGQPWFYNYADFFMQYPGSPATGNANARKSNGADMLT